MDWEWEQRETSTGIWFPSKADPLELRYRHMFGNRLEDPTQQKQQHQRHLMMVKLTQCTLSMNAACLSREERNKTIGFPWFKKKNQTTPFHN